MQKFTISSLLLVGLLTGSGVQPSNAQGLSVGTSSTSQQVLVAIPNQSIISYWNLTSGVPVFSIPGINTLFSTYGVNACELAFPDTRFDYKKRYYVLSCNNDSGLIAALHSAYPQYFRAELIPEARPNAYYPNDYSPGHPDTKYLGYINAPEAWGIEKGNPDVVIGIIDLYLHTGHPDIAGKYAEISGSYPYYNHGTQVAGMAAGGTDNATGVASIGFKSRIHFANANATYDNYYLMINKHRPIVNLSYSSMTITDVWNPEMHETENTIMSEMYENGIFVVAAAGNGENGIIPSASWRYQYPASLDHVFSVTGVGWKNNYSGTASYNVMGVYNKNRHDSTINCQRNDRVDLMAPARDLYGITYRPGTMGASDTLYELLSGTSFSAPLVAGTAGLMKSANACLTPYQLECLLKNGANSGVLSLPENLPFAGRLGAGALDAYESVKQAKNNEDEGYYPCNDPATQTMYISGIEVSGRCRPGSASNGHIPQLTPLIENGTPPYTYRWDPVLNGSEYGNQTELDDYYAPTPQVISSYGNHHVMYRVWVYDSSPIQKTAAKYFKIKLTDTAAYDLASRDSYMDMFNEANRQDTIDSRDWQIWESPDLWVRNSDDGGLKHQHPEYTSGVPNHVYVRVRNVGCAPAPAGAGNVHVYWTKASTGENWEHDWRGWTFVPSSAGGPIPAGGMLPAAPKFTPALQPGQSVILKFPWQPTRPQDFEESPSSVDVCLLSRIVQAGPNNGMTIEELINTSVTPNVRNNNNIVTRNLLVTDLVSGRTSLHWIDVANADGFQRVFNIELINDRTIHPHFSGDFSVIGKVRVHLGGLYDRWVAGGTLGSYTQLEPQTKSIIFNGVDPLRLENITLDANERFTVKMEYLIVNDDALTGNIFTFHLRQFPLEGGFERDLYGNVSMQVRTYPKQSNQERPMSANMSETVAAGMFEVYPNPAGAEVTISNRYESGNAKIGIIDITGRLVYQESLYFMKGSAKRISIGNLTAGIYLVSIHHADGYKESHKLVKH